MVVTGDDLVVSGPRPSTPPTGWRATPTARQQVAVLALRLGARGCMARLT